MEENIGKYFCETEFTNIQLPQYVHQRRLLDKKKLKDEFYGTALNLDLKKVPCKTNKRKLIF